MTNEQAERLIKVLEDLLAEMRTPARHTAPYLPAPQLNPVPWPPAPIPFAPMRMAICGCPVGTPCCNSSCPHMTRVTCGVPVLMSGVAVALNAAPNAAAGVGNWVTLSGVPNSH
jgi:hypothetical protein